VLIADTENHVIRRYSPRSGRIVRVAGTGVQGTGGLGGPPEDCPLNRPHGAVVHPRTGELYIADSENHRVLRVRGGAGGHANRAAAEGGSGQENGKGAGATYRRPLHRDPPG